MSPWGALRREAAGLRRSIRYDLGRRVESQRERDMRRPTKVLGPKRPRCALAATGVTLVLAGGAAGTYLAVAGGLGLFGADPAGTGALPADAPAVVLPSGTPAVAHPNPTASRPSPRPARPPRAGGGAAAVVVEPPMPVDEPSTFTLPTRPSPTPESTVAASPSASATPSASPSATASPSAGQPPAGP